MAQEGQIKVVREVPNEVKNAFGVISDYLVNADVKGKLVAERDALGKELDALKIRRSEIQEKIEELDEKIEASENASSLIKDLLDIAEEA